MKGGAVAVAVSAAAGAPRPVPGFGTSTINGTHRNTATAVAAPPSATQIMPIGVEEAHGQHRDGTQSLDVRAKSRFVKTPALWLSRTATAVGMPQDHHLPRELGPVVRHYCTNAANYRALANNFEIRTQKTRSA
jgi:hypothetical protein